MLATFPFVYPSHRTAPLAPLPRGLTRAMTDGPPVQNYRHFARSKNTNPASRSNFSHPRFPPSLAEEETIRRRRFYFWLSPRSTLERRRMHRVFRELQGQGGAAAATKDWGAVAANVPGRDAAMCEALFKLNRSFLSLPIDAINGVALSAMMNDHYNNIVALRESTPERDEKAPQSNGGRGGPAATPGSGRVVGKRTPRSNPGKKTAAAVEKDVLEMAGAALVSMSPGGAVASGLAFAGRARLRPRVGRR